MELRKQWRRALCACLELWSMAQELTIVFKFYISATLLDRHCICVLWFCSNCDYYKCSGGFWFRVVVLVIGRRDGICKGAIVVQCEAVRLWFGVKAWVANSQDNKWLKVLCET